jgi:uncharacterized protein YhhL (DUF1145 family)
LKWTRSDEYLGYVLTQESHQATKQEIGKTTMLAATIHISALITLYLLTVYLSTMMLDITYPYLTMGILYQIRIGILMGIIIFSFQIIIGLFYRRAYEKKWVKLMAYIFGILQLFILPIGTYAGVLILKDLRYDAKQQRNEEENELNG